MHNVKRMLRVSDVEIQTDYFAVLDRLRLRLYTATCRISHQRLTIRKSGEESVANHDFISSVQIFENFSHIENFNISRL